MSQTNSMHGSRFVVDRSILLLPAAGVFGGVLAIAAFALALVLFRGEPSKPSPPAVAAATETTSTAPSATPTRRETIVAAPSPRQVVTDAFDAQPVDEPVVETTSLAEPAPANELEATLPPRFGAYQADSKAEETATPPAVTPAASEPTVDEISSVSPPPPFLNPVALKVPRRSQRSEDELRRQLRNVPEIVGDSESIKAFSEATSDEAKLRAIALEPRLQGLPLRMGDECNLDEDSTLQLGKHSSEFRRLLPMLSKIVKQEDTDATLAAAMRDHLVTNILDGWTNAESVPAIEQMFQVQERPVRMLMIEVLSEIDSPEASVALARRALYDLDADVRFTAVVALHARPRDEYLPTLLAGFRYPWEEVAFHAADALITLGDRSVVAELVQLLDEPNPNDPFINSDGNWAVREVASINHLRNCQLCHASSTTSSDPVRGLVPTPGQPLPVIYYQGQPGNFVRADRTYIKQDFSLMQQVENAHPWPGEQRLDYVVRVRELSSLEQPVADSPRGGVEKKPCPQHDAVLYVLRALTGIDAGDTADDWGRELLRNRVSLATP